MTERKIYKRQVVELSIAEGADFLVERENVELGLRFIVAVRGTIDWISEMPGAGSPQNFRSIRLRDIRSFPVRGFENWRVFYRELEDGIEILDVIHGGMDIKNKLGPESE